MPLITEKRDVQDQLINHLIGIGWEYLPPEDVMQLRGGDEAQPLLPLIAREQLVALNEGLVTTENVEGQVARLRRVRPSLAGSEEFLHFLRGHRTLYHEAEKRELNLSLIDYDDLNVNRFCFTQEFAFRDHDRRRPDMVLFVNGFPVVLIENKSPVIQSPEIQAFDQVQQTYTDRIPELLKFIQFFAACDLRIHYGASWNDDLKAFYRWKSQDKDYGLEALSKSLFDRQHVLQMLRDYVIFFRMDDQTQKFVLRPHQIRAAERVVRRVTDNLSRDVILFDRPIRSGLVWHTQGSGKTLTMIVAAHMLRRIPALENPTFVMVVDRRELETQTAQNLEAYGFPAVVRAKSKAHLCELLRSDYRGLIVTLIHKFDRIPKNLTARDNVVVLIDEAHRSQEGDLATYMRAALPNAFYFGFTGTPIDRGIIGRGTFETFGKADPEGYLDKYGIDESIEDKTTVPLYYTLAPVDLRLERDVLEQEFFRVLADMGIASLEQLDRILDKANKLKAVLKAPERVDRIARHVASHFRENVEPLGFKAFVVAVDREACALYKDALNEHLPTDYSRVVYTGNHKDPPLLRKHHLDDDAEKRVRIAFRDPDQEPRILIVTQKLLTGYDAPVLYAMYLDKPLKDHTLLQAIARVNRPYPAKEKASGLVVDYLGIFEDLQRALSFDTATITTGLIKLEELRDRFLTLLSETQEMTSPIEFDRTEARVERVIDHFFDSARRDQFVQRFKELQRAFEILSPDPFLRDNLLEYAEIGQVYQIVYEKFNPEADRRRVEREILKKTDSLIREHVKAYEVGDTLPLYPINRDIANVIQADDVSDRVRVINLYRSIIIHISAHRADQPYLISIGQRVEDVMQRLKDRQISVQIALQELTDRTEEIAESSDEQERSGLPPRIYALFHVLRRHGLEAPKNAAEEIEEVLSEQPNWPYDSDLERRVRFELYKRLYTRGTDLELKPIVEDLLHMYRMTRE